MKTSHGLEVWALVTLWLLAVMPVAASDGGRLALVIGNSAYAEGALTNPVNDATDFAAKLRELGFQAELLLNADQQAMERAIDTFTRALAGPGKVGLFYFAGHGIEYQGRNYLLPIGAVLGGAVDLRYKAVDAGRVLDGMGESGNGLNMVVLDACRNNPFPSTFRSASRGLARLSPAKGTLVLYATQPGAVASDGDGRNGVFTKHLLATMAEPGLEVEQAFKRTALAVDQETGGTQTPWVEGVVLGQFAFRPAVTAPPPPVVPGPVPVAPPPPVPAGHLQVSVNTPAEVRIDDRYSGEATPEHPLNLSNLPVGRHRITVSASGYRDGQQDTHIQAGQWNQEIVALSPNRPPEPPRPKSGDNGTDSYPEPYRQISSPSFACTAKLKPSESIICGDPALSRADGIMGSVYGNLRASLGVADADSLRSAQRAWIKKRDRTCPVSTADLDSSDRRVRKVQCLRRITDERFAELWALLQALSPH